MENETSIEALEKFYNDPANKIIIDVYLQLHKRSMEDFCKLHQIPMPAPWYRSEEDAD